MGCATLSMTAAREKLPTSATERKYLSCFSSMGASSTFPYPIAHCIRDGEKERQLTTALERSAKESLGPGDCYGWYMKAASVCGDRGAATVAPACLPPLSACPPSSVCPVVPGVSTTHGFWPACPRPTTSPGRTTMCC